MLEIHHPARLPLHHDHVTAPDIACLHCFTGSSWSTVRHRGQGRSRTVEDTPRGGFLQTDADGRVITVTACAPGEIYVRT
jgi:hypothetical protein